MLQTPHRKTVEFQRFAKQLAALEQVIIQAHDFPDHDAVAASYGLQCLLAQMDIASTIVYNGLIDRISLKNMITELEIPILKWKQANITSHDKIITVDGCIGEKNILDLPGDEIAVIDHHQVSPPNNLWFCDVRSDYGSTATIITEYYRYLDLPMSKSVATALMIGLSIDTANLTRGFNSADIEAFSFLHEISDPEQVNRITRNSVTRQEITYYQSLLNEMVIEGDIAFACLGNRCPKNMLGVLGDFLLTVHEVNTTILAALHEDIIQISLRTEKPNINVGRAAQEILKQHNIGFGGGHAHMAGGVIDKQAFSKSYQLNDLKSLFVSYLSQ